MDTWFWEKEFLEYSNTRVTSALITMA